MSDCSGYGFGVTFTLCLTGKLGDGNYPDLIIKPVNALRNNFDESKTRTITAWRGGELYLYMNSYLNGSSFGFGQANCTSKSVYLTITPDFGSNTGTLLLEFKMSGCTASSAAYQPQVFENCGSSGEHIISEMSTYTLDQSACIIVM